MLITAESFGSWGRISTSLQLSFTFPAFELSLTEAATPAGHQQAQEHRVLDGDAQVERFVESWR